MHVRHQQGQLGSRGVDGRSINQKPLSFGTSNEQQHLRIRFTCLLQGLATVGRLGYDGDVTQGQPVYAINPVRTGGGRPLL